MEQNSQPSSKKVRAKKINHRSVRVGVETARKLAKIQQTVNKKLFGKKIHPDSILSLALDQLNADHIQKLQQDSLSNADRLELSYREYLKSQPGISKDEYIGKLMSGEISSSPCENAANSNQKLQHSEA